MVNGLRMYRLAPASRMASRAASSVRADRATTRPAMVGMVALETPLAMARAFPDPRIDMTSKTWIMPVTVPMRPSRGHSATSVFSSGSSFSSCSLACEIVAWRILRASQEEVSRR